MIKKLQTLLLLQNENCSWKLSDKEPDWIHRIRILLPLTKNQFKHNFFSSGQSDFFRYLNVDFLPEKMEKFTWKCAKALFKKTFLIYTTLHSQSTGRIRIRIRPKRSGSGTLLFPGYHTGNRYLHTCVCCYHNLPNLPNIQYHLILSYPPYLKYVCNPVLILLKISFKILLRGFNYLWEVSIALRGFNYSARYIIALWEVPIVQRGIICSLRGFNCSERCHLLSERFQLPQRGIICSLRGFNCPEGFQLLWEVSISFARF